MKKRTMLLTEDCVTFGEFLREVREKMEMTQQQFAAPIGITDKTLSRWEQDKMPDYLTVEFIDRIIDLHKIDVQTRDRLITAFACTLLKQRGVL